ncbi:MAG: GHMP kinase [Acidimicrobiales bacterium]
MAKRSATAPLRVVRATTPVRICDIGGWTDTRVAGHGEVLNFAVRPGAEVQVAMWLDGLGRREVRAVDYAESFQVDERWENVPARHRLLAAAIEQAVLPEGASIELTVSSHVPPGSSTGTSAAVAVAVLGALDFLQGVPLEPGDLARRAHLLEVERLGQESGVQDQFASAYGGVSHISVNPYPHARATSLYLPDELLWEIEQRFVLVFLGRFHGSSVLHEKVIANLAADGPGSPALQSLREAAQVARSGLLDGDLSCLASAMVACTQAQAELHADLVSSFARQVIATAREHGAIGWKVNGAGGDGGSLTLLAGPGPESKAKLLASLADVPGVSATSVQLSRDGLRAWEARA